MSRSVLHNWECAIERLGGDNTNALLDIAQDIYNTGYVHGKNYELSVIEDIKAEIEGVYNDRPRGYNHSQRTELFYEVMKIIDKHTAKSAHDVVQEIVKNGGIVDL